MLTYINPRYYSISTIMSANPNSVHGEFHAKVPPSKPLTTKGHAPGTQNGPSESHVKLMPAGTAPPDRSFAAGPLADVNFPEATFDTADEEAFVSAQDSLTGATSKDVHRGLGHPGSGQPASQKNFHKERSGLEGRGGDTKDWVRERGLDRDHQKGGKLTSAEGRAGVLSAEGRLPSTAEHLATEMH